MVSIVISTWNRAETLQTTLESLTGLLIPPAEPIEIIVVDNGSTDDTRIVANRYASRLPLHYVFEPVAGLARARNRGVAASQGRIVLITDDDVKVDPGWVTGMVDGMQRCQADVAYGRLDLWWENGAPDWYSPMLGPEFGALDHGPDPKRVAPGIVGFGANHAFTREAFDRLGGYDTRFGLDHTGLGGNEDEDFFLRAHQLGLVVAYCPAALLHHFVPAARATRHFLRERSRRGALAHYNLLAQSLGSTKFLGLPTHMWSTQLTLMRRWIQAVVSSRQGDAFFYELRVRRFCQLITLALKARARALFH